MCLQVPGKVIEIKGAKALIDYDIEKRSANLGDAKVGVGDWVIVVGSFIVDVVPSDIAIESLAHWKRTMLN